MSKWLQTHEYGQMMPLLNATLHNLSLWSVWKTPSWGCTSEKWCKLLNTTVELCRPKLIVRPRGRARNLSFCSWYHSELVDSSISFFGFRSQVKKLFRVTWTRLDHECSRVDSPSEHSEDYRDGQRSKKASDGKYGHCDGPEEGGRLYCKRLSVSLRPCCVVESFNVLQYKIDTAERHAMN